MRSRHGGDPPPSPDADQPLQHRVLLRLEAPRCPRELRERIPNASRKGVETAVRRLLARRLIECVTPELRQSRLYRRTHLGRLLAEELGAPDAELPDFSESELRVYAWVQAGAYRRETLRAMDGPHTPRRLRRLVLPYHERFGATHLHTVLREFTDRGVAVRDALGMWRLTDLGRRVRAVDRAGLSKRPGIVGPWMPLPFGADDQQNAHSDGQGAQHPKEE